MTEGMPGPLRSRMNSLTEAMPSASSTGVDPDERRPGTPTLDLANRQPSDAFLQRSNSRGTLIPAGRKTSYTEGIPFDAGGLAAAVEADSTLSPGPLRKASLTESNLAAATGASPVRDSMATQDARRGSTMSMAALSEEWDDGRRSEEEAEAPAG